MSILLLELLRYVGISIAIGATTVLLAQWIAANADDVVSRDEKRLLSIVRMVTRLGFFLTLFTHVALHFIYAGIQVNPYNLANDLVLVFLAIIFISINLYNYRVISDLHHISILTTTWYAILIVLLTSSVISIDPMSFLFAYILFNIFAVYLIDRVKNIPLVTPNSATK